MTSRRLRLVLMAALAAACLTVLGLTLWPTHVDGGTRSFVEKAIGKLTEAGVPVLVTYTHVEFMLNVVMFSVPAALLALLLRGEAFAWIVLGGGATSVIVETLQLTVLEGRTPSVLDVLANGLGSAIGAGAVVIGYAVHRAAQVQNQRARLFPQPQKVPNPVTGSR